MTLIDEIQKVITERDSYREVVENFVGMARAQAWLESKERKSPMVDFLTLEDRPTWAGQVLQFEPISFKEAVALASLNVLFYGGKYRRHQAHDDLDKLLLRNRASLQSHNGLIDWHNKEGVDLIFRGELPCCPLTPREYIDPTFSQPLRKALAKQLASTLGKSTSRVSDKDLEQLHSEFMGKLSDGRLALEQYRKAFALARAFFGFFDQVVDPLLEFHETLEAAIISRLMMATDPYSLPTPELHLQKRNAALRDSYQKEIKTAESQEEIFETVGYFLDEWLESLIPSWNTTVLPYAESMDVAQVARNFESLELSNGEELNLQSNATFATLIYFAERFAHYSPYRGQL